VPCAGAALVRGLSVLDDQDGAALARWSDGHSIP
jgi:hypothetical protein